MENLKSPLFILVGVQMILVAALFLKTSDLEKRLEAASVAAPATETRLAAAIPAAGLSEGAVRAILRDELASFMTAAADGAPPARTEAASPPRTAETERAFLDVQQETRRLIAKGAATEAEMAALETRISELPPAQRQQALSAISRAVSNGTLKARF